ncbi:hypothetical protein, partial [Endozoicomonas sp. SESOKO4]|uniref:hypothetical protein n=1 Tax=Endozoicomonas sp. SESOKO4 TaxID=2828745 RepID=UPI002148AF7C
MMLPDRLDTLFQHIPPTNPTQDSEVSDSFKRHFRNPDTSGVPIDEIPLANRLCSVCSLSSSDQTADYS